VVRPDDLYRQNPADDVERLAVDVVRPWVGERGVVHDTSTGHGPDFRIEYLDGRLGLGEVAWHEDRVLREMWANTFRRARHQTIDLPERAGTWTVGLQMGARIDRLYRELHILVELLGQAGEQRLTIHGPWPRTPVADVARRLGVNYVAQVDPEGSVAYFFMPSTGGAVPTDPDGIVEWIDEMLSHPDYADTTGKLLPLEADERHVFLMTGSATRFGVDELLRRSRTALPARTPAIPPGITHVWVVPEFGDAETAACLWTDQGWESVPLPPFDAE
jgi:hypothetical protein